MPQTRPMPISFAAFVGLVLPVGVLVGAVGAYPTWKLYGSAGLTAELAAGLVSFVVITLSAAVIVRCARFGPAKTAFVFMILAILRLVLAVGLALALWRLLALELFAMLLWVLVFHVAMLICECLWLVGALRRDYRRVLLQQKISDDGPDGVEFHIADDL